jgi:hypothetical protein
MSEAQRQLAADLNKGVEEMLVAAILAALPQEAQPAMPQDQGRSGQDTGMTDVE